MTERIRDLTGIVVAGGKSSRMGRDKAFLDWQGRPLIQAVVESLAGHVSEIIVVAKEKEKFKFQFERETLLVADRFPYFSPLVGIATGLFYSRTELNFVLACDMPQVKMRVVKRLCESMEDFDAVLPRSSYGLEPLCAVYRKSALGVFEARIRRGSLSVRDALEDLRIKVVPWDEESREEPLVFMNLNTPAEYGEGLKND
ncbi:MAG: molybdenum cofactor guanylyltransferase [Candidatus Omnitrophica bacterium]|nr:molybdenum cofactor guanylyltransferase [Candidatus Omnitrophota bacterium]